jgi:predicted HTH transcriptional regulator
VVNIRISLWVPPGILPRGCTSDLNWRILMQSSTEQALYDFKVGLHPLIIDGEELGKVTFSKIVKTLTAMANTFPNSTGYCLLGVADNKTAATKYKDIYGLNPISYSKFFVTGINAEANKYHGDIDKYFTKITQMISQEPLSDRDKDNILRNISTVNYFDKTVIVLKIESGSIPSIYDKKYYVRNGSNISEVEPEEFSELFARFHKSKKTP